MLTRIYLLTLISVSALIPNLICAETNEGFLASLWADEFYHSPSLSPDGRHLALMKRDNLIDKIYLINIGSNTQNRLSSRRDSYFRGYTWVDNNNIAVKEISTGYGQRAHSMIISYDINVRRNSGSFNEPSRASRLKTHRDIDPYILAGLRGEKEELLITVPRQSFFVNPLRRREDLGGGQTDVIRLNVRSGQTQVVAENPGNLDHWITDSKGEVRVGMSIFGKPEVLYRSDNGSEFEVLDLPVNTYPIGFVTGDEILLMVTWEDSNHSKIRLYNPEERQFKSRAIGIDDYDLVEWQSLPSLRRDPASGAIIGIDYQADKPGTLWLDPGFRRLQKRIDQIMPFTANRILGLAADDESIVLHVYGDTESGKILLWKPESNELVVFRELYPKINNELLASSKPIKFSSRDGSIIHGYLTLPGGGQEPYPLINIVHGGPMARDVWGSPMMLREVSYFASLGYAVLQVNFRGSTGYGLEHQGDSMVHALEYGVTDVADGTRWAVEEGFADPERLVIYGASFGGYSAIASAVHEPDLYRLAIGSMGVYDFLEIIRYDLTHSHPIVWEVLKDRYGDPDRWEQIYHPWSPIHHAAKIKSKVLLMHGQYDARVDIDQYLKMAAALRSENVEFETYRYTTGGHGFGQTRGWVGYFRRIAEFLNEHNK